MTSFGVDPGMVVTHHPTTAFGTGNGLTDPTQIAASEVIRAQLAQWGVSELYNDALNLIKQGLGTDAIVVELQNTDAWKKRFAANEIRKSKGLTVLSPQEYLSTERQYQQLMRSNGLPQGFYDQTSDFTNFLANDVSPTELQQRIGVAQTAFLNADDQTREAWKRFYGLSDGAAVAAILDPEKALPLIQRQATAAQIAGAATRNTIGLDRTRAEQLATLGVTQDTANKGFADIGQAASTDEAIAKRFGLDFNVNEEEDARLLGLASAQRKLRGLQGQEAAQFSGKASANSASTAIQTAGRY